MVEFDHHQQTKMRSGNNLFIVAVICIFSLVCSKLNASPVVVAGKGIPVHIVTRGSNGADEMGRYLQDFLKERHFEVAPALSRETSNQTKGFEWILTDSGTIAKNGAFPGFQTADPNETFWLKAGQEEGRSVIHLTGKTIQGLRAAVACLVCKVVNHGDTLTLESGESLNRPFISRRILDVGDSARRQIPDGSPFKGVDIETWPLEKLRSYPELFWQFGFNALQVEEVRGYGALTDEQLLRIRKALQVLAQGARSRGMYVSLFQWGDCLFKEGVTHSWNNPAEHAAIIAFAKDLAGGYANEVDHVNIHFGDPGGCLRDGCDSYATPQKVTAAYYEAFRAINPKIEFSLSTWAWGDFWSYSPKPLDLSNYNPYFPDMAKAKVFNRAIPEGAKFLDDHFMPLNIGIALHRTYNRDQARAVLAAGRPVDVWTWYVGDNEMLNSYWLNMKGVDKIVGSLPQEAGKELRSYSFELNFHGWPEIINTYIGGRKLWNPQASLKELETEFCTGAFGPKNAAVMVALYEVCENGCSSPIPTSKDFGTHSYNAHLKKVLKRSSRVRLAADWKPNFAFPVPPQEYVDQLNARLRLILCVSEAREKIDAARRQHADPMAIDALKKRLISKIPVLPIDPLYLQTPAIANEGYRIDSFAEMIEQLK